MALFADGVDPASASMDEMMATAARLQNSARLGQMVPIGGGGPIDKLLAGDVAAAVARASDTVGLESSHPDVRFVVPDEGGLLLTDVVATTSSAANPTGASSYIRYASDPDHAAHPVPIGAGHVDDRRCHRTSRHRLARHPCGRAPQSTGRCAGAGCDRSGSSTRTTTHGCGMRSRRSSLPIGRVPK